jgi:Na+/proline symporter
MIIYGILMIVATLFFTRRSKGEDFHVGNRDMGAVSSAMSIAATWIWAPALFTSSQQAYTNGIAGLFWFVVPNVLCLLVFIPFAKRIRIEMPEGITLSGYMGEKYKSKGVQRTYLFQLTALTFLSTTVQLLAGGKIMSVLTGVPFIWMVVALAGITFAYSQFSGIKASVLTDVLQMLLMLAACAIFVPWALKGDGIGNLIAGLGGIDGSHRSILDPGVFFAFGLSTAIGLISGPFGDQCFWQRAFSIKKDRIGRAFGLGALFFAIVPVSMGILGFIAAGSGFSAKDTGIVNLELVTSLFPKWATIPFMLMLISGLMSTLDSNLCAIASLTTDITHDHNNLKIPILSMAVLLLASIGFANVPGLTVTGMFMVYGTLRSSTLLPTVFTLKGVKLKAKGVMIGVIAALCLGLPVFIYGTVNGLSLYKTIGCLMTVLISGILALLLSKGGAEVARA